MWKGIKDIINVKSKNFAQPTCVIHCDKNVSDPNEIANSFNKYFTSIADDILKKIKYEGHKSFHEYLLNSMNKSILIYNYAR